MTAIAIALGSSLLWGISDFMGGLKSRTFAATIVLVVTYLTSLTAMAIFVAARGEGPPGSEAILAGLGAGLFGIVGLTAFYRGLAIGTMSIVAPIASTGVALPVLVGLASGDQPGLLRSIGLVAAIVGVVLASRQKSDGETDARLQRQSIMLAIVAGLGFGTYFTLAEVSSQGDVGWALLLSRIAATPFIAVFAVLALRRGARGPRGRDLLVIALIGLIDLGANALYNVATTIGELSTVAVASSLYPVITVLLAASLLGERVRGLQRAGVVVALCGVVLIAAGA